MRRIMVGSMLAGLLLLVGYGAHLQEAQVAYHPENLVRLHVIANSDLDEDQRLKNEVRDVILEQMGPRFKEAGTIQEVRTILQGNLDYMRQLAENHLQKAGCKDPVRVEYGVFPFPVKGYGSIVLPAGEYEAVKVIIGEGRGANWWCVLFPPLCFVDITQGEIDETSAEEVLLQVRGGGELPASQSPQFKLKTAELLRNLKPPF